MGMRAKCRLHAGMEGGGHGRGVDLQMGVNEGTARRWQMILRNGLIRGSGICNHNSSKIVQGRLEGLVIMCVCEISYSDAVRVFGKDNHRAVDSVGIAVGDADGVAMADVESRTERRRKSGHDCGEERFAKRTGGPIRNLGSDVW